MRRRIVMGMACVCGVAGCEVIAGLPSYEDAPDAGVIDSSADGNPSRDGGGHADATNANDVNVAYDAADAASDSAPSHFCSTQSPTPAFCADFDDGLGTGVFSSLDTGGGGIVTLVPSDASAPNAMSTHVTQSSSAVGIHSTGTVTSLYHFQAKLRVDTPPSHANLSLFVIGSGPTEYFLVVKDGPSVALWQGPLGGAPSSICGDVSLTVGEWQTLDVRLDVGGGSVTSTIGGATLCNASSLTKPGSPLTSQVHAGYNFLQGSTATTGVLDDILVYIE